MATSTLLQTGRSGKFNGNKATYTADYRVVVSSSTASPIAVLAAGQANGPNSVPAYFATYSMGGDADTGSFAQDFDVKPEHPQKFDQWIVSVTWRPPDSGSNATDATDAALPPATRAVRYFVEFMDTTIQVGQAYNIAAMRKVGAGSDWRAALTLGPFQNSAGDQFVDSITEDDKIVVLCARKNFADLTAVYTKHRAYNRTVNNASWNGYAKHKAKFLGIEVGDAITETVATVAYTYYPGVIKVALSDTEWYVPLVNQGMRYLDASANLKNAVDSDNRQTSGPVLLATDGTKLGAGVTGNVLNYLTLEEVDYTNVFA